MVAGALWAALAAFVPLAQYTSAMVLWRDSPIGIQAVPEEAAPIPAALVWHPRTYRLLTAIAGFPMPGILVVYIGLAAAGAYIIVRILNPTFRVTTGVDWNRWLLIKTYMHTAPLIKVIVTIVPVQVAVFLIWLAAQAVVSNPTALLALTAFLVGGSWWLALSRNGFIGDCDSGNYLLPSWREAAWLVIRGGMFGIVVWLLFSALLSVQPSHLLRVVRSLGGVGEASWWPAAGFWLVLAAAAGAACVLAAVGLGTPYLSARARSGVTLAALLATAGLVVGTQRRLPAYLAARLDCSWPKAEPIEPSWWRSGRGGRAETVWIAVPVRGRWRVRRVAPRGVSGAELSELNIGRICRLLARRRYRSALTVPGFIALYDDACRRLDVEDRLTLAGEALRRCGDPLFARLFLTDLWQLAGYTPARDAAVGLRDRRLFAYLTADARVPAGDLCARNGRLRDALRWYREAGLPAPRAEERASRMAAFSAGQVRGTVSLKGPAESVSVGLVPADAELVTLLSGGQPAEIGPFALRAVVRTSPVGNDGRFVLADVTEGRYVLLLRLGGGSSLGRSRVTIESSGGAAEPFAITSVAPDADLGNVRILVEGTAGPNENNTP